MSVCLCPDNTISLRTIATGYGCVEHGFSNDIRLCPVCDLAITCPPYEKIEELYQNRDSSDFQPDDSFLAKLLKPSFFDYQASLLLKELGSRPAIVADIGCGDGRFTLAVAKQLGPLSKVYGIDFHDQPPDYLCGNSVSYLPMPKAGELTHSCDLVILRHTLEHTDNPVGMLKQLKELLKPGGKIFVEVPNRRSPWATIFGKHFDSWYTPYHRVHFSRKSLHQCLELAGFSVIREFGSESPKMGRSICHWLGTQYNTALFIIGILLQPLQVLVGKIAGEPVHLIAIAHKN